MVQLWTDACKLDQIFKTKIKKATKEGDGFLGPENKLGQNTISYDTHENIFVIRGLRLLLNTTRNLRLLHLVGIKISQEGWDALGDGLKNNKSLYKLSINRCSLKPENLQALVPGLGRHEFIETIDLSANGIEDECGALIVSIIKKQAERRDNDIWIKTLRKKAMKRNTGMKVPRRKSKIRERIQEFNPFHGFGLTKIELRKNFLGTFFMRQLVQCLNYDEYMRYIDLRENKVTVKATADLISSLGLNKNIVNFDLRENPCYNESFRTKLAIRLVKNIEAMKKRREILKKKWINLELLKIEIPENMQEIIRQRYKVEVNDDSIEAKESIMGNPPYANFKTYSDKSPKKRSAKAKDMSYTNDYGLNARSRLSHSQRAKSKEYASNKDQSPHNINISGDEPNVNISVSRGGHKTAKSRRVRANPKHDESTFSYISSSAVKYLSPAKRNMKCQHFTSNIENYSKLQKDKQELNQYLQGGPHDQSGGTEVDLRFGSGYKPKRKHRRAKSGDKRKKRKSREKRKHR